MKNKLILFIGALFCSVIICAQENPYYYYQGKKQYLEYDTQHVFVSVKGGEPSKNLQVSKSKSQEVSLNQGKANRQWTELMFEDNLSRKEYFNKLNKLKQQDRGMIVSPYLRDNRGKLIGLSELFYVCLKAPKDSIYLQNMANKMKVLILEQDKFMPLWYVLSITEKSEYNTLEMANVFYESNLFRCAEPNFMYSNLSLSPTDPYWSDQWGLKNTGQYNGTNGYDIKAENAWLVTKGEGVVVAVVDEGLELNHPDLSANIYPLSYDAQTIVRGT